MPHLSAWCKTGASLHDTPNQSQNFMTNRSKTHGNRKPTVIKDTGLKWR
jgi:hypothetical protein